MNATLSPTQLPGAHALNETTRLAQQTTTLSPRFYTTDYAALNELTIEPVRAEWEALLAEFKADKNLHHFRRDAAWDFDPNSLSEALKKEFIDFLVSSITSEFSGCVLYAEIRKRGTNPDLNPLFKYLARDEARHAGFINECLQDFGVDVDLGFLAKAKQYTYFSPKFILMATYLSEKIGYARYITIFRHLEQHPEHRFHPMFRYFQQWCTDEYRHGEAIALLLRAQPELLKGFNRLWIRFFQLSVFATMFVRDHRRVEFHRALGIEPEAYGMKVFEVTLEICKQIFPLLLDLENPKFLQGLRTLERHARGIEATRGQGPLGAVKRLSLQARSVAAFARLYLLPTKPNVPPEQVRLAPRW